VSPKVRETITPSTATRTLDRITGRSVNFISAPISGLQIIEPRAFEDARGFFAEVYRSDVFAKHGITAPFVQDNHSASSRGTLRGLHCQIAPQGQAKLVRVVSGEIFDVAVDVRPGSATYGRWHAEVLSAANRKMFFIPEGFLHGFLVLSDRADVLYKTTDYYAPQLERGVAWNDPQIGVVWPDPGCPLIVSDRDRRNPALKDAGPLL
jgi:dTDP-4-dehydrorhamnose 3,5-epimerase